MDDRDLREFYLTPYKALIEKDKLPSVMTAYGAVNGTPMSAHEFLVDSVIRRTYGMDGRNGRLWCHIRHDKRAQLCKGWCGGYSYGPYRGSGLRLW